MLIAICTRTSPQKVAEALASGSKIQAPIDDDVCPGCKKRWDASHLVVEVEAILAIKKDDEEERQRRQVAIINLEMAEIYFLASHGWTKGDNGFFIPPENYRNRKPPFGLYSRSHAVNSQKQAYSSVFSSEKRWEDAVATGRGKSL